MELVFSAAWLSSDTTNRQHHTMTKYHLTTYTKTAAQDQIKHDNIYRIAVNEVQVKRSYCFEFSVLMPVGKKTV